MLMYELFPLRNRLARIVGQHPTASQVLNAVRSAQRIQSLASTVVNEYDYTQIDPTLSLGDGNTVEAGAPRVGIGYAGLTPGQRAHFLRWIEDPTEAAPAAFQALYLAHLEVALLEDSPQTRVAQQELKRLERAPLWQGQAALARTSLLAYWLAQDGPGLATWLADTPVAPAIASIALGCQALIGEPLQPAQVARLLTDWELTKIVPQPAVLTLRLRSLTTNLGGEPLAYALAQLESTARQLRPWRCNHRDLRIALPQPDVRSVLTPLLVELATVNDEHTAAEGAHEAESEPSLPTANRAADWHLILEFGHSRSDLFHFALTIAQRLPGFVQILDENRKLVYRIVFKKSEMRPFWRLWDYVQSWSTTRVYLNGQELEKWQVFPYSQYLR